MQLAITNAWEKRKTITKAVLDTNICFYRNRNENIFNYCVKIYIKKLYQGNKIYSWNKKKVLRPKYGYPKKILKGKHFI